MGCVDSLENPSDPTTGTKFDGAILDFQPFTYQIALLTGNEVGAGIGHGSTINYTLVGSGGMHHGKIEPGYFHRITRGSLKHFTIKSKTDLGKIGSIILHADLEPTLLQKILGKIGKSVGSLKDALKEITGTILRPIETSLDIDNAWELKYISVSSNTSAAIFPYYGWFDSQVNATTIFNGAYITQDTPGWLKSARRFNIANNKDYVVLEKKYGDLVPRACKAPIPIREHFSDGKAVNFTKEAIDVVAETLTAFTINTKKKKHDSFPSVKSISKLYEPFKTVPLYAKDYRWQSDMWWGSAWLTGPFYGYFKPADEVIDILGDIATAVTSDHQYMNGASFEDELKAGRLFAAEFSVFKGSGVEDHPEMQELLSGRYLCPEAVCLFRACPEKTPFEFLPVAIQLEKDGPVFLPSGDKWQWRTVKAYVMCNAGNVHQVGLHWSECHAAAEPICAAVLTEFSNLHPLRQLLMPHCAYTLAINGFAWDTLIAPPGTGGAGAVIQDTFAMGPHAICLDEEAAKQWSKYVGKEIKPDNKGFARKWWSTWGGFTHPGEYKTRWGARDQLKVFPPRDDGIAVGEVIEDFVSDFVDQYYEDDTKCKGDVELQGFIAKCVTGLGKAPQEVLNKYAKAGRSKGALKHFITAFIFQVSCVHAARNFCQYNVYGTPHFAPTNMRVPPPKEIGQSSEKEFLNAIPNINNAANVMGVVSLLSQYSEDDVYLARSDYKWVTNPKAKELQRIYSQKLRDLVDEMEVRNKNRLHEGADYLAYTLLMPNRIPTSVAI